MGFSLAPGLGRSWGEQELGRRLAGSRARKGVRQDLGRTWQGSRARSRQRARKSARQEFDRSFLHLENTSRSLGEMCVLALVWGDVQGAGQEIGKVPYKSLGRERAVQWAGVT